MANRNAIHCSQCQECKVIRPAGFLAVERFFCPIFEIYVDESDGCTFGSKGTPQASGLMYNVELGWYVTA